MALPTQKTQPRSQDLSPEAAQLQLKSIDIEQAEIEAEENALKEISDKKHRFIADAAQLASRLARTLEETQAEINQLREEAVDLEDIKNHFQKNLDDLKKINPHSWPKGINPIHVDSAYITLQRMEKDFGDAVTFCTQKHKYSKTLKKNRQYGSPLSWYQLRDLACQGIAYNLPLLALGLIILLILLIKL